MHIACHQSSDMSTPVVVLTDQTGPYSQLHVGSLRFAGQVCLPKVVCIFNRRYDTRGTLEGFHLWGESSAELAFR